MSTRSLVRRTVAAVAGGAVVAGGLMAVAPAPAAHAAPANAEAQAAAGWLADQLDANGLFTYLDWQGDPTTDIGTTLDFGLSLVATGADPAALAEVRAGIDGVVEDYVGATLDPAKASQVAKAAAFYQAVGEDLSDVVGIDLVERLEDSVDATGRLGTGPNVYGQVWAVKVLDQIDSTEAAAATDYLISLKCADAAWGYESGGVCTSVVDGTAYTLLALLPQKGDPEVDAAISAGLDWLKGQRRADGGFGDWGVNTSGTTSEVNGSGLAAWALGAAGEKAQAASAASWVAAHQVVNLPACGLSPVAGEDGALAYDDQNMTSAIAGGITSTDRGTWTLASAQALAGLAYLPAAQPTVPTTFVDAGTTTSIALAGARAGQQVCVTGLGAPRRLTAPASATFAVPAGTADHAVTVTFLGGSTTTTLKALDATKLKVKVPSTIKAKKKATIKVKGLAAGEPVTVKVGKKTATGTANAKGVAKVKVKVKKKGKAKVKVVGAFPDRKGKATTRVR